jgi:hypothetical protein
VEHQHVAKENQALTAALAEGVEFQVSIKNRLLQTYFWFVISPTYWKIFLFSK